jgi:uncharacterized protein with PQ loop repeat
MYYNINYGFIASIIGLSSFIPIVLNIIKTKNTSNFIWSSIILAILSSVLWMLEGIQVNSISLILKSIIYIFLYSIIIIVKIYK